MSDFNKGAILMCLANAVMMFLGFEPSALGSVIAALTIFIYDYITNK